MDRITILSSIQEICKVVFKDDKLTIQESTSSKDVEQWDSLSNLFLIDGIEREFDVKFSLDEILHSKNIGDLVSLIQNKKVQ